MKKLHFSFFFFLFSFAIASFVQADHHVCAKSERGKAVQKSLPKKKLSEIKVYEFFSFTCPHCKTFEDSGVLKKLKRKHGKKLVIEQVPVGWSGEVASKAHLVAKKVGKAEIFKRHYMDLVQGAGLPDVDDEIMMILLSRDPLNMAKEYSQYKDSLEIRAQLKELKKLVCQFDIKSLLQFLLKVITIKKGVLMPYRQQFLLC